ncbi:hypothetical protein SDC9_159593 [bioreactor metagenome]|uniref:Uncharacterized protein n=1 Tax=bioreactor metagenome TaxID=1076179 RepID=A0A645FD88_9ZZZZ
MQHARAARSNQRDIVFVHMNAVGKHRALTQQPELIKERHWRERIALFAFFVFKSRFRNMHVHARTELICPFGHGLKRLGVAGVFGMGAKAYRDASVGGAVELLIERFGLIKHVELVIALRGDDRAADQRTQAGFVDGAHDGFSEEIHIV